MNDIENNNNISEHDKHYKKAMVKAKTNLLWFSLFSIVMFFAGLTSAFIVSKGNGYWVSLALPNAFIISTIVIIISSTTMFLATKSIKNNKKKATTLFLVLTFTLGIGFGYFQFKGWEEVYNKGYAVSENIYNKNNMEEYAIKGEYGKDFVIEYGGNKLNKTEDGNYWYWGKMDVELTKKEYEELIASKPDMLYGRKLFDLKKEKNSYKIIETDLTITKKILIDSATNTYKSDTLLSTYTSLKNDKISKVDTFAYNPIVENNLPFLDTILLSDTLNVKDKEEYFAIVEVKKELTLNELSKLKNAQNTSSSYFYVLTIAHLLHVLGCLIYLLVMIFMSVKNSFSSYNYLKIKLGGYFWHFLGGLWLYLFLFLYLIH